MIDSNPIRICVSIADWAKNLLASLNISFNLLTIDWWFAAIGAICLAVAIGLSTSAPGYWPAAIAGCVLAPYVAYMILALFWRPVPFFHGQPSATEAFYGCHDVTVFGEFDYDYEVPDFIGSGKKVKTGRARVFWSSGTATISADGVVYRLQLSTRILNSRFMGIMKQELDGRVPLQDAEMGVASLMWRRVGAVKVNGSGHVFILALKRRATPGTPPAEAPTSLG